jgi:hypothetical protein
VLLLIAAACGDDDASSDAGSDAGDASADGSLCAADGLGCACTADDACKSGTCVAGTCKACARGEPGCACMSNGSCSSGATCAKDMCEVCKPGNEGCPCAGGGCSGGMTCLNDVCTKSSCEAGKLGCPCAAQSGDASCADDLFCDANKTCRTCSNDVVGCPCGDNSTCRGGLTCDSGHCKDKRTCRELVDAGLCAKHQRCDEDSDSIGTCVADSCDSGYTWSTVTNGCTKCASKDCSDQPTCDPGALTSIAADCAGKFENCVEDGDGARCEGCVEDAVKKDDRCVPILSCGSATCSQDEYCDSGASKCEKLPCPVGQAKADNGKCSSCAVTCSAVGLTGRVWPFRTRADTCVCETVRNYFMPSDQRASPARCDADQDGWVRQEADDDSVRADAALRSNARCAILRVDGVVLRDEFGSSREIRSCGDGEGLVAEGSPDPCTSRKPMRLLETERNDLPGKTNSEHAPTYDHLDSVGSGGRLLQARELTSLTKACVTANADYNDNGDSDLTEQQVRPGSGTGNDDQQRLQSFAYFTELYRAWYEAPSSGTSGKLVIAERSRCDTSEFYLSYWDGDNSFAPYSSADPAVDLHQSGVMPTVTQTGSNYWRNCERRRDPRYDTEHAGFDFEQWSCGLTTGSCPSSKPAHAMQNASEFDWKTKLLRGQGLCGANGASPADGAWRGLNHSSQFKCVQIDNGLGVTPPKYRADDFGPGGKLILNLCETTGDSRPTHEGSPSYEPVLRCAPQNPTGGVDSEVGVAWAAVTFRQYTDSGVLNGASGGYEGGCIDEDTEWGDNWLCPSPLYTQDSDGLQSYGRYSCYGQPQNYLWGASESETGQLLWGGAGSMGMSVFR